MIPDNELIYIATKLLDRTKRKEVNWHKDGDSTYEVQFSSDVEIRLSFESPSVSSDYYTFAVFSSGNLIGFLTCDDGTEEFTLLEGLYREADKAVTKWDLALDEIKKMLESDENIGPPNADY